MKTCTIYENLYYLYNFSVNLKLLSKIKFIFLLCMYIYIHIKDTEVSQGIMEDLGAKAEKSSQQQHLSNIAPPLVWLSSVLCHSQSHTANS